ncbi:hypothetical protein N9P58_01435 [Puniceicoccaceae bacterium]|nr:hypothetical protein [Puniceicoccaceae bacterium]
MRACCLDITFRVSTKIATSAIGIVVDAMLTRPTFNRQATNTQQMTRKAVDSNIQAIDPIALN